MSGNFAPQTKTCPLTPCTYTGTIPEELVGGQYIRNGSNPVSNDDLGRDAHWFDGDGMLAGVSFARNPNLRRGVQPEFVNQYLLTDVYLSSVSSATLQRPVLPSITTLVNPLSTLIRICLSILRTIFLVILSRLPGSKQAIERISVANTSIMWHDGRALATCESGPPLRVQLPSLETVGWYDGISAQGEEQTADQKSPDDIFGGSGIIGFMREWTTAHPKVDPLTNEMLLFHNTTVPPFVQYSVVPAEKEPNGLAADMKPQRMLNRSVKGISSAKMMHDFGVSRTHTVIMDLPLSLDPLRLAQGKAPISYDCTKPSRFGVFPRHEPSSVRWFETAASCIFHTANTWDIRDDKGHLQSIELLACRMTSAAVVFTTGNIVAPRPVVKAIGPRSSDHPSLERSPLLDEKEEFPFDEEEEQCRLYYYSFDMSSSPSANLIPHQYALSRIPFEFPSVHPDAEMVSAEFVYGCTSTNTTFNSALGKAAKIDGLVKFNVKSLISRGRNKPPVSITGCVDTRTVSEVQATQNAQGRCSGDIQIFFPPAHHYASEPRFVPAANAKSEDDGYLLTYVFDERQISSDGRPLPNARSELWIIDAKNMRDVLAKIQLPQRVPYGLHGNWFSEQRVQGQRPIETVRKLPGASEGQARFRDRVGRWFIDNSIWSIGG